MRAYLSLAVLLVPSLAWAQNRGETVRTVEIQKTDDGSSKRLEALEEKLQSLLKEIQALRGGKKVEEKREALARSAAKGERLQLEFALDEKAGRQKIMIVGEPDAKGKVEYKARVVDGKTGDIELQATPGSAATPHVEKRVVVVDDGRAKPATTVGSAVNALTQYYRVATVEDANTVHLTRVTYTLEGGKAKALEAFLKDNAKAKVLETKVEGDKLIVTTTPDVQGTIGQVVGLMTGKLTPHAGAFYRWSVEPAKPGAPTAPAAPKPPVAPKPPKDNPTVGK